jgi:uncharacterized protein (DUF927 family)
MGLIRNFPPDQIKYLHYNLGFHHNDKLGTMAFFADKAYNSSIESTLANNNNGLFGQKGSFKKYQEMIVNEVLPSTKLQLAFVLGFVAPLIPLLSSKTTVDAIISNFSGLSSTGKTTSLGLMASVWGSSAVTNRGIVKTFFATNNSLISNLSNNVGFPVIFDDYETGNETAFGLTALLFQMAQGESKGRCDIDGSQKQTYNWKTLVALSGESSIFERTVKKQGLHGRVIEFNDYAWTSSKQNADNINSTTRTNYGFYGPMFVQKLASLTTEDIEGRYDKAFNAIDNKIKNTSGVENRMASKMAYIYLAAQLVKELLEIDVKPDDILDLLINNEKETRITRDVYSEALDTIRELITRNLSGIQCCGQNPSELKGRLIGKKEVSSRTGTISVSLLTSVVDEELERKGFNDRKKILKYLADRGYLERDKDRLYRKIKIGFLQQKCYKFIFIDDEIKEPSHPIRVVNQPAEEMNVDYSNEESIDEIFKDNNNQ